MKILLISLGCDKNLVDSEKMLGILESRGYTFTDDEEEADAALVNTCCFIGDAKEESIDQILRLGELRKSGQLKALIISGCLSQRYRDQIHEELPEVDACIGIASITEVADAFDEALGGAPRDHYADLKNAPTAGTRRIVTTGGHFAYLKIAEGCNKNCTYCIIPKVRGGYRSTPMEELEEEARLLAERGVKELILVAQETTLYGIDLYGRKSLPELVHRLAQIPGIAWIRILYGYPEELTDEIIEMMATEPKVCHYLDLPIQHCSDRILRAMGRRTTQADLRRMVEKLRSRIPDICLRTTLISGFPGETQEEYEELYRFVNELEFDRLGVFAYSQEEDTVAATLPDQVPEEVKIARRDELMELQQAICFDKAEEMVGRELTVMVEGRVAGEDTYVTRTYRDAPEVDGYLFLEASRELLTGDMVRVRVTGARDYDLIGELIL